MRSKNFWVLLLLMLTGVVLGGFIGDMTEGVKGLSWLAFGQSFGLEEPITVNLGILVLTFGISIKITMAGILGVALALFVYRFL